MNYIDISTGGWVTLNINANLSDSQLALSAGVWTIYKDGNSTSVATFSPSTGAPSFLTAQGYYQTLSLDLDNLVFDSALIDETQYTIEGISNDKVIYRGKFQTTSKDLGSYSVNENEYTERVTNNNYTILD